MGAERRGERSSARRRGLPDLIKVDIEGSAPMAGQEHPEKPKMNTDRARFHQVAPGPRAFR